MLVLVPVDALILSHDSSWVADWIDSGTLAMPVPLAAAESRVTGDDVPRAGPAGVTGED